MKTIFYISLTVIITMLLASCGLSRQTSSGFSGLNGEWGVIEMNGNTLNPDDTRQVIVFDTSQQTVSGNSGCNRFSGRVEYNPMQKNIIRFSQMVSTRMACMDMTLENEFLQTIDKVVRYEFTGTSERMVVLYGTDNKKLFVLQKR